MSNIAPELDAYRVAVDALRPYPGNARRGNLRSITRSLKCNGQYRPIVANRRTGQVLVGNHTYRAARDLGWEEIAVSWVDVDEEQAKRIVLADNRTSDLADYDTTALVDLLETLPDLDGSGFTDADLEALRADLDEPLDLGARKAGGDDTGDPGGSGGDPELPTIRIAVGPHVTSVDASHFVRWASWSEGLTVAAIEEELRGRLGLVEKPAGRPRPEGPKKRKKLPTSVATAHAVEAETVRCDHLNPYPENARQGDVGAIARSLAANGQFRPIVVNRQTREILAGNHTWLAAKSLGWESIAVTWVDVDDEQARRIVLADNRTSDQAGYDNESLLELLRDVNDLEGTGFDPEDLDDLVWRASRQPTVTVAIGTWSFPAVCDNLDVWAEGDDPAVHALRLLGL